MGQLFGKFRVGPEAEAFCNLSRRSIGQVWKNFNDIADGFGVSRDEVQEVCVTLKDELNVARLTVMEKASALFDKLDTDKNGLIDALEMICSLAALSGMKLPEMIEFILSSYDFDGTGALNADETTLALKSVALGLSKLTGCPERRDEEVEHLVSSVFRDIPEAELTQDTGSAQINIIVEHLMRHPDVISWYGCFAEQPQLGLQILDKRYVDTDHDKEGVVELQARQFVDAVDWKLSYEQMAYRVRASERSASDGVAWFPVSATLLPSEFANSEMPRNPPDVALTAEWVYGYQAEKAKNNLRYTKNGQIVYHNGPYAIQYDFDNHNQTIFTGHTNEILCLTVHPDRLFIASGEKGATPKVLVWNALTMQVLFSDIGFHQNGVSHVAFSKDGTLLASCGMDFEHCIAVHDWQKGELLFTSRSSRNKCLGLTFLNTGAVATCGDSYVNFWMKTSEGYMKRRGNFSRLSPIQAQTCISPIGSEDSVVTGTSSGEIFLWTDRNCVRTVKGHKGGVVSIYNSMFGVLTGGKDFRIRLWTHKLEPGAIFNLASFGHNPIIRSVCMSPDGASILVGTKACEIYEISSVDGSDLRGGLITSTHSSGSLRGLAMHPKRNEFASVGDDKKLRIWDMNTKTLLKVATFETEVRCVAYSPLGDVLAVGLGGEDGHPKTGGFAVINEDDLSLVHEAKDSNKAINVVTFSGEGETLAIGSDDGAVYLYAVQDEYEMVGRCNRHSAPVIHIDFSVDGEWIRTNSSNGELCFFNADNASFQSNAAAMRDVQWGTQTCIYSWHTRGIHRTPFTGEIVTKLQAPCSLNMAKYLIGATNYGFLKTFPFPCVPDNCNHYRAFVHAGSIASTIFSYDAQKFITAGLTDRTIVQWKLRMPMEMPQPEPDPVAEEAKAEGAAPEGEEAKEAAPVEKVEIRAQYYDGSDSEDLVLEARDGETFLNEFYVREASAVTSIINGVASDPNVFHEDMNLWTESVIAPTNPAPLDVAVPDMSLRLEYAYGYRCQDMRNNVRYTDNENEISFVAASVGVVMNKSSKAQNFYQGHTESITAFASSRDGTLVATGQMGLTPRVLIWKAGTRFTLGSLPDLQKNAVGCLAFSNDNTKIATVSLDSDHTVSIYLWKLGVLLCRVNGGARRLLHITFSPDDTELLAVGLKTIVSFSTRERCMIATRANIDAVGSLWQTFYVGAYFADRQVIATNDGNLYCIGNGLITDNIKIHKGPIYAMDVNSDRTNLVTGGRDGLLKIWNTSIECIKEIKIDTVFPVVSSRLRSVCFNRKNPSVILVGTGGAEIMEINTKDNSLVGGKPILQSHGCRELWGLAPHPTKPEFVTGGDDYTIRIWDARSNSIVRTIKMDAPSRAVAYSPDGKFLVVGFGNGKKLTGKKKVNKNGAFVVLNTADFKLATEVKDANEPIRCVKFSADSKLLAVASEDSKIYVYSVKDQFAKRCIITNHRAPITTFDFSQDGSMIMSVDSSKRMCFSETIGGTQVTSTTMIRDEKWSTWSAPIGWQVRGLWYFEPQGVETISTQRSWNGMLLAAGTNVGRVFIVKYPCPEKAGFVSDSAHCGPISQIAWCAGDGTIVTTGSRDHAILQWRCVYDNARESGDEGGRSCEDSEEGRDGGQELDFGLIQKTSQAFGKHAMAWTANVAPPIKVTDDDLEMPKVAIEPEFLYGNRLSDARQMLKYNREGNIICAASNFGIVYDRLNHREAFYTGHVNMIISLDVTRDGLLAATGDLAKDPELHFWDALTACPLSKVDSIHRGGITAIAFSSSGLHCVTLGQDILNSITVLMSPTGSWKEPQVIASVSIGRAKMLWVQYVDNNNFPIVVGGHHSMYFFKQAGSSLERTKGVFGRRQKIQTILCGCTGTEVITNGEKQRTILTGTVTGHLYLWLNGRLQSRITAHDASVYSVTNYERGFISGGKDGQIKVWNEELEPLFTLDTESFSPQPYFPAIHSLKVNMIQTKLIVGMRGGEVYEVSLNSQSHQLLMEGHAAMGLYGMDPNPKIPDEVATVGEDGMLRIWSMSRNICLRKINLECPCRSVGWSPDGSRIVVGAGTENDSGMKDGAFLIVQSNPLGILSEDRFAKKTLTDIKYNADGTMIAFTSRDSKCYIVEPSTKTLLQSFTIDEKGTFFSDFDFNMDGTVVRLATNTEGLYNYNTGDGNIIASAAVVRSETWNTNHTLYSWMCKSACRPPSDGILTISVDVFYRHPSGKNLIAMAYQDGSIRIYNYPCQTPGAQYIELQGICSQAWRVRFSTDGAYLLALDSYSRCVVKYKISYD